MLRWVGVLGCGGGGGGLAESEAEGAHAFAVGGGDDAAGGCLGEVFFVDADVEAGLLELLFDVEFALLDEGEEVGAEPGDLGEGEAVLGDVDGLAGEVGRGGVAFGGCGVAVGVEEALLELDGADGGVDLERGLEAGEVLAGEGVEEEGGPGAAEAAVGGEAVVDAEGVVGGDGDEDAGGAHVVEVGVVMDAFEAVAVGDEVLAEEDLMRAFEGRGYDEAAAPVVEGGEDGGVWRGVGGGRGGCRAFHEGRGVWGGGGGGLLAAEPGVDAVGCGGI